jgi:hypothetical protein
MHLFIYSVIHLFIYVFIYISICLFSYLYIYIYLFIYLLDKQGIEPSWVETLCFDSCREKYVVAAK